MIRSFIQLGFNQDESGGRTFDGAYPHIGGGLMPLNVRFGQPLRAWGEQTDHLYPAYDFPFTYARQFDPLTRREQGVLDRCSATGTCPRIFHVATALEVWEGRQSLGLTDPLGALTCPIRQCAHLHHGEHAARRGAAAAGGEGALRQLPAAAEPEPAGVDHARAAARLHRLGARRRRAAARGDPAHSRRHAGGGGSGALPANSGERLWRRRAAGDADRAHLQRAACARFRAALPPRRQSGIITVEPPHVGSASYGVVVPQVDADGNDIAGIRSAFLQVPIGTYTGWNPGRKDQFENGQCNLQGSFIPFAATRAERMATGDPRPSIEERYPTRETYVAAFAAAADSLVAQRFLLPNDARTLLGQARQGGIRSEP